MQTSTPPGTGRPSTRLEGLESHAVLGRPLQFVRQRREQLLYLIVGGWNTVFGYAIWAIMQFLLGDHLHYLVIVVLSWPVAVLNAYLGYRYVVFRSRGPILRELPRFSMVYVGSLLLTLLVLPIALHVLPLSIYVVNALFTAVVVIASYIAHKYFSFGGGRRGHAPSV